MGERTFEIVGLTQAEATRCAEAIAGSSIVYDRGHAYITKTLIVRPQGCRCPHCTPHSVRTPTSLQAYEEAMYAAGVPHEPLSIYDSNSWRRVGLVREYREVMVPTIARDGHPDIRGTDLLRAMVAAFNVMLELRQSEQQTKPPHEREPPHCSSCSCGQQQDDTELASLRTVEAAAMRVASSRREGIVEDKGALDRLDAALEGRAKACPCKGHPTRCFNHPNNCGCQT